MIPQLRLHPCLRLTIIITSCVSKASVSIQYALILSVAEAGIVTMSMPSTKDYMQALHLNCLLLCGPKPLLPVRRLLVLLDDVMQICQTSPSPLFWQTRGFAAGNGIISEMVRSNACWREGAACSVIKLSAAVIGHISTLQSIDLACMMQSLHPGTLLFGAS